MTKAVAGIVIAVAALAGGVPAGAYVPATGSITGTISAPAGADLSAISVAVIDETRNFAARTFPDQAEGTYEVSGLRPGRYIVHVSDVRGDLVSEYHGDAFNLAESELVAVGDGQTAGIDFELATGAVLQGSVTGHGASNILAVAYDVADYPENAAYALIQPDGSYVLRGLVPGREYKLQFSMAEGTSLVVPPTWYGGGDTFNTAESIVVANPVNTAASVELPVSGTVSAHIAGLGEGQWACVYVYPAVGSTELPRRAVGYSRFNNFCGYSPDAVAVKVVYGSSAPISLRGIPAGSYRMFLGEAFRVSGADLQPRTRAGQWTSGAILKSNAAVFTVHAGQTTDAPAATYFPQVHFKDVGANHQFFEEIAWLGSAGVSTGWVSASGGQEFRPVTPISRDAMAAFMYRLAGSPEFDAPDKSPFKDVSTDNMYYKEIAWLKATGVSSGWTEDDGSATFRPLSPIARDAMAAFLYRFAQEPEVESLKETPFADVDTEDEHFTAIAWLASMGITTGWTESDGERTFRALEPVNRDAMAAFMYRFAEMVNEQP